MDFEYLRAVRTWELELIVPEIPPGSRILEIGSGAGWQARQLASRGFEIEGIDVVGNDVNYDYRHERVWDVKIYDGHHIPFPDNYFDVVFSSNVLEHIPHVRAFQQEISRVLKDEGLCIHILPSASWRFWTIVTYYVKRIKRLFRRTRNSSSPPFGTPIKKTSPKIFPPRHGERGNAVSELYLFSAAAWKSLFRKAGWHVIKISKNKLFYTGEVIFGSDWSLRKRKNLSSILGSSCNIFYLKKSLPRPTSEHK